MQAATRVGALVVVFLLLIFGAYQIMGRTLLEPKADVYYAEFKDATGITQGARVLMAGVPIGSVTKLNLANPQLARVELSVLHEHQIPAGSIAQISSSLTGLGDTPVTLVPPAQPAGGALSAGAVIPGTKLGPLAGLVGNSDQLATELELTLKSTRKLIESTNELIANKQLTGKAETLMASATNALNQFTKIGAQSSSLIAENRRDIHLAVHNAALAVESVQQASSAVAQMLKDPRLKDQSMSLLANLNKTTEGTQKLLKDVDALLTDPKLRNPINESAANMAQITKTGTAIAENTNEITKNGAIISKKAIDLTDKANAIADEAQKLLKKVDKFLDKTPGAKGPALNTEMSVLRQTHPGYWRNDIDITFPFGENKFDLGMYDAFESNKIIAQMIKPVNTKLDYRMGIYASKPGLGVDYALAPKLGLRGDFYNLNDPRLDVRLKVDLKSGVFGWLGIDRAFNKNSPSIGLGIKK